MEAQGPSGRPRERCLGRLKPVPLPWTLGSPGAQEGPGSQEGPGRERSPRSPRKVQGAPRRKLQASSGLLWPFWPSLGFLGFRGLPWHSSAFSVFLFKEKFISNKKSQKTIRMLDTPWDFLGILGTSREFLGLAGNPWDSDFLGILTTSW